MQNHFDLFHLPQRFAIDMTALDSAYHEVQNQVHPDKFTNATDAEKRVAKRTAHSKARSSEPHIYAN
jgi:molecular chaperone HscB